jgi:hypothetical protein
MIRGTISADKTYAAAGSAVTLTVTPDPGYVLKGGTVKYSYGGADYTPGGSGLVYSFTMPASDVTVSAEFEPLPPGTYSVTAAAGISRGTVNADPAFAAAGTAITLTVTPDSGYALKGGTVKYSYGGADYTPGGSGLVYSFTMPAANVTVSAEFNTVVGTITIEGFRDEAVTITPDSATISWQAGASVIFTLNNDNYTAEAGNLKWYVEGEPKTGTGNSLTINARDYVVRSYSLTAMIKVNDQWYSADTGFTVVK